MEITRKFWLVGAVSVFMVANFASATVINLDMSTAPTTHGFYTNGTGTEDITTNPGQLTITTPGGTFNYNQNITDGLGTGDIISFGMTIAIDSFSNPGYFDRQFVWADAGSGGAGPGFGAQMAPGMSSGTATYLKFGDSDGPAVATPGAGDGLAHTYRIDIVKATGIGTFYFDGTAIHSESVVKANEWNTYISFGDRFADANAPQSARWDDVFFSNEVPGPATGTVLVVH